MRLRGYNFSGIVSICSFCLIVDFPDLLQDHRVPCHLECNLEIYVGHKTSSSSFTANSQSWEPLSYFRDWQGQCLLYQKGLWLGKVGAWTFYHTRRVPACHTSGIHTRASTSSMDHWSLFTFMPEHLPGLQHQWACVSFWSWTIWKRQT